MVKYQGFREAAVLLLLGVLTSLPALAQKITGEITGTVNDSSGAAVANATAMAENVDTGLSRTARTSGTGSFHVPDLPIGTYRVSVSAPGFKVTQRTVQVSAAAVTHAEYILEIGQRTETVTVEGVTPLLEYSGNENSYIDSQKLNALPLNGRDLNSVIAVTPGVQRAPGGGFLAISINGSRTTSNNYLLDGLYNNDRYYGDQSLGQPGVVGMPAVLFPPEAIEEVGIQENPSAEFGVKGGAPINMVMKSGTNAFHGDARWVRHTSFADAANYFSKINGCSAPGSCEPTPLRNMQFGGTFGGPIVKDKTFFFLYYEGQRYISFATKNFSVPNQADVAAARAAIAGEGATTSPAGENLFKFFPVSPSTTPFDNNVVYETPTTATMDSFGFKLDHKLTSHMQLAGRYIFGDSLQSAPSFSVPPPPPFPADLFNSVAPSRAQMAGLSHTWTIGNNKVLESRFGWNRFSQIIKVNNKIDPKSLGLDTGPLDPADFGVPYVYLYGFTGYIGGVQGYPITTAPDQTYDWSEHFSWVKGNHSMKMGGNFQKAYTNSLRNRARTGLLAYGYYPSPGCASYDNTLDCAVIEQLLMGKMDEASRNFGDSHRHIVQKSLGLYFTDDWKVKPRLTLTLGLRYDLNGALGEKNNIGSNFFPDRGFVNLGQGIDRLYDLDKGDFGPRAGFAWDVFGNGKMAIRGGYSLTYDVANFGAIAAPYSFAGGRAGAFTQPNLGQFASLSVNYTADHPLGTAPEASNNCFDTATLTGDYICLDQPLFGAIPGPFNAFSVVKDFKTPHAHNFNLSIQRDIARNNVITIGYSGQRGGNLALYRDLNASPLGSGGGFSDRPYTTQFPSLNLQHVIQLTNLAHSQYDSLQASFNQRNFHGFNTQTNFTWSKCFDDNSVNRGGAGDYPQLNNPLSVRDSYGLCDHDVRFNFNIGGVYTVPDFPALGRWLNGWQISSIFTAISGRPFTALIGGSDPSGQGLRGSSIRAAWDGAPVHYNPRDPLNYVEETYITDPSGAQQDPCGRTDVDTPLSPFYRPCSDTVGSSRRNQLIGPGLAQLDMSLIKNTKFNERLTMQFRWEVFNILNRGNFYYFVNNIVNTAHTFGQVNQTSDVAVGNPVVAQGGPRNMNFALRFVF